MLTYRYRGHSMSDPAKYRSKEEVAKMRQESDPIDNMRRLLLDQQIADEDTLKDIDKDVKAIIIKAADFAQENPEPDPKELYTDILAEA
jgi:pyruvate dehydrogenase E1 component alpha subunit